MIIKTTETNSGNFLPMISATCPLLTLPKNIPIICIEPIIEGIQDELHTINHCNDFIFSVNDKLQRKTLISNENLVLGLLTPTDCHPPTDVMYNIQECFPGFLM